MEKKVDIWKEPCVVQNERSLIVSNRGDYADNMKVCDLILEDYTGWKETVVRQAFDDEQANRLLTIPFSVNREDTLAWKFEKMGHYSTKSGCIVFMRNTGKAFCTLTTEVDRK